MKHMQDWPDGYGLRILDEVDSTLDEAARIAPGLRRPEWILARRQTAARGRRGRAWAGSPENLAATLVMRPEGAPQIVALRSFVAALAVFDACVAVTGRAGGLALKWPNDVLLNGGKLAGILLESAGTAAGVGYLAIGIGVNLAAAPPAAALEPGALAPVSLLSQTGAAVDPESFLIQLAAAYAGHERRFSARGFAPIREDWLARAARIGRDVTARTGSRQVSGRFETVDAAGNLVLATQAGRVAIAAADVFF